MKCSLLDQYVCHRAFSLVQLCLQNKSSCLAVRICLQLQNIRSKKDHIQQAINALSGFCGNRNEDCASSPVFRNQSVFGQLLFYTVHICARLINFVYRYNNLDARRFGMVNRLNGLGHHAVIGSHNKNRDIRGFRAAHTHGGKCLVPRCIQERYLPIPHLDAVGTDILRNSSRLAVGHMRIADVVQKRCFTMIDMTHDADDRGTRNEILLFLFVFLQKLGDHIDLLLRLGDNIVLQGNFLGLLIVDLLVYRIHFAFHKEIFDNL